MPQTYCIIPDRHILPKDVVKDTQYSADPHSTLLFRQGC